MNDYDYPFVCIVDDEDRPPGLATTSYREVIDGLTGDSYLGAIQLRGRIFKSVAKAADVLEHEHLHWVLHHIGEPEASEALDDIVGHPGWRGRLP